MYLKYPISETLSHHCLITLMVKNTLQREHPQISWDEFVRANNIETLLGEKRKRRNNTKISTSHMPKFAPPSSPPQEPMNCESLLSTKETFAPIP